MKKFLAITLMGILGTMAMAQNNKPARTMRYTVSFESHHGESFNVFMDGDIINRMPQSRVMLNDVTDRTHEVVVVLKRPVQKAAVLNLVPGEPTVTVLVFYDERTDDLSLYTPSHNRAENRVAATAVAPLKLADLSEEVENQKIDVKQVVKNQQIKPVVSDDDVSAMVARMKGQNFDSDRLALGKVIVASSSLTSGQIARLAETIDYSSSQVEFLKYAYPYCIDKMNYHQAVSVLTFSSDKKKVMDFIATQK